MRSDLLPLEDDQSEGRGTAGAELDEAAGAESEVASGDLVDLPLPGDDVPHPNMVKFQFKDRTTTHARVSAGWFEMEFDKKDEPFFQPLETFNLHLRKRTLFEVIE